MKNQLYKVSGWLNGSSYEANKPANYTVNVRAKNEEQADTKGDNLLKKLHGACDVVISEEINDMPTINELAALIKALKKDIGDEYRASDDPDDNTPAMSVTFGINDKRQWSYQTGDNSFTGGAYGKPHWAVVTLTRRCDSKEIAREVLDQWAELMAQ
jgi:hypothetical protein